MKTKSAFSLIINIILFFAFIIMNANCKRKEQKKFLIAFSQCTGGNWRDVMLQEMQRELSFHTNIKLEYCQAGGITDSQIVQTDELIRQNPDLLIISPNESEPLNPVIESAFKKGIPVIVIDRKINLPIYTAYVGGDNYSVGKLAGEYAVNLLGGKGNILEITILPGSSPAEERDKGFKDALRNYPEIKLTTPVNGEWFKDNRNQHIDSVFLSNPNVDLIFAQNDYLAIRVAEYIKKNKLSKPKIIGVDGLPGINEGLHMVSEGIIDATMLYPTGGEEAIRTAIQILNKKPFNRENLLSTTVIDSSNVRYIQLQSEKMLSQQSAIERQQQKIEDLKDIYNNQRTFVFILILSLILTIVLAGISFYSLKEKRKGLKKLRESNEQILKQKQQLELMSRKTQEANDAKLAFFTNISHEFRTPLTLILGPLEEILENNKLGYSVVNSLELIQKNVFRLLRLINQLMDFRKIETKKMKLHLEEHDLVKFLNQMILSYKSIAKKRGIDLRFITQESTLFANFDQNLLDKVIFNLLSNAFKFTPDDGTILLSLQKDDDMYALIILEDNGIGISEETQKYIFEPFYQGEFENYKGSGIGLALSKELIELHNGFISVASEKGKGSIFSIKFPLKSTIIIEKQDDLITDYVSHFDEQQLYTAELNYKKSINIENNQEAKEKTVLLIEDNQDLRTFLKQKLQENYNYLEATDGKSALKQAFEIIPDLIICDLVIPGKDGIAITEIIKNDIRTSHIPIILLTAKTALDQQIEGIKNGADAYITKPFNMQLLLETIATILKNREKLKEHFTTDLPSELKTNALTKIDRKFISEFSSLVEVNISNENFSIDHICRSIGISRVQLNRKSKALLNMTVNEYILSVRLQKSKYLLQHEKLSVSEVAYQVGFTSPAYFSTVFKSKFGISPKSYSEK